MYTSGDQGPAKVGLLSALMKYWELIADNLSKAGWSWGCVATMDREGVRRDW
jgi:hypothetical protein